ncbi:hypothetical protein GGS23DRAFT_73686 [Durotheca rogersii]|uniref:uncharacterized protein n=1 Tax=Durotheca rogersii TaxID=419775 RepID=UPI00222046E8|nr:uncharacterized protein GGS23DRAFT_73686 [Durotheca rogersii]KAI5862880.1 hypothetical protein GGS23DRAFT_73686 [Durotheca rogersii]
MHRCGTRTGVRCMRRTITQWYGTEPNASPTRARARETSRTERGSTLGWSNCRVPPSLSPAHRFPRTLRGTPGNDTYLPRNGPRRGKRGRDGESTPRVGQFSFSLTSSPVFVLKTPSENYYLLRLTAPVHMTTCVLPTTRLGPRSHILPTATAGMLPRRAEVPGKTPARRHTTRRTNVPPVDTRLYRLLTRASTRLSLPTPPVPLTHHGWKSDAGVATWCTWAGIELLTGSVWSVALRLSLRPAPAPAKLRARSSRQVVPMSSVVICDPWVANPLLYLYTAG